MSSDIHPHWKSTNEGNSSFGVDDKEFWPIEGPPHHHIEVKSGGNEGLRRISPLLLVSFLLLFTSSLGFLFLQGVNRIRADLTEGTSPDVMVEIGEAAFSPATFSIEAGKSIEWRNGGTSNQQIRSDQLNTMGEPIVSSPLILPNALYQFKVPEDLAGTMLTIRSRFLPTVTQTITIETAAEATVSLPPLPPAAPEVSSSLSSVASLSSAPSLPSIPPNPSPSPSPNPSLTSLPTPILHIGSEEAPSATAWPSLLRINRFTVGNPLIPAPSPIHSAVETQAQIQHLRSAAPLARSQPATGPALSVLSALTLGVMPFFFRKKRTSC